MKKKFCNYMSFSDLPIVDESAKASEESVLFVRSLFSKHNGFISREEYPDYGCDLEVELIFNNEVASGKKFPIQIKSWSDIKFIKIGNDDYLSKPFKTSRLAYLLQRPPVYGIIVIYDDNEKICYFDYAEKIVQRIINQRGNENWKNQESVNIHIPKDNLVNVEVLPALHARLLSRFEAQESLISTYGSEYQIPSFSMYSTENKIAKLSTADLLKKYGLLFINSNEILNLYKLLSEVSMGESFNSKELIFISCVVYGEMGKCLEAELYLAKAFNIFNTYEEYEREILQFLKIKVDFLLGNRNGETFLSDLRNMSEISKNEFNSLQIDINILNYVIVKRIKNGELDENLEDEIHKVFQMIDRCSLDEEKRMFLKIFHTENLNMFISSYLVNSVNGIKVKEGLGLRVSRGDRFELHRKINSLISLTVSIALGVRRYSAKQDNVLLKAHSSYVLASFYLAKEFDFFLLTFRDDDASKKVNFEQMFCFAVEAHNIYLGLGLLKDARLALICAYDLSRLATLYYCIDITRGVISEEEMLKMIRVAEKEMGLSIEYISVIENAFIQYSENDHSSSKNSMADLTDNEIDQMAKTVLQAYSLPAERLVNIIAEVKSFRFFYQFVDTLKYELLTNTSHFGSPKTYYANPTKYVIRNLITGLESIPSPDLESLVKKFNALG